MSPKVVCSQIHYMNDINKVSYRIRVNFRDIFNTICNEMYSIATKAPFNE